MLFLITTHLLCLESETIRSTVDPKYRVYYTE
jgi:hypothetical protein